MDKDEIKSELLILDPDGEPEEITRILGLTPAKIIHKGDIRRSDPSGKHEPLLHEENAWILKSGTRPTASVEEHISKMLEKILPKKNAIASLASNLYVELSIYGFSHDATRQAFHLDKEMIKQLAEFGVSLDIDVYPIVDDAEMDSETVFS